jgi:hypothetical protein
MTRVRIIRRIVILCLMLVPASALAQQPAAPNPPAAQRPVSPLAPRTWIVAGAGYAAARAGCATCDREGVLTHSYPILVDAGVRVTPRVDAGIELYWVRLKVNDEKPIQTTFVLGVMQMRPWVDRGFFLRAGMGIGIAGNGLNNPNGPTLQTPYTTNALAINFGVGWEHRINRRWAVQAHALQHVAALGELTTESGERIRNVVGNYWTVGFGIVIR